MLWCLKDTRFSATTIYSNQSIFWNPHSEMQLGFCILGNAAFIVELLALHPWLQHQTQWKYIALKQNVCHFKKPAPPGYLTPSDDTAHVQLLWNIPISGTLSDHSFVIAIDISQCKRKGEITETKDQRLTNVESLCFRDNRLVNIEHWNLGLNVGDNSQWWKIRSNSSWSINKRCALFILRAAQPTDEPSGPSGLTEAWTCSAYL